MQTKNSKKINKKKKILVVGYLPPPQEGTAKLTEIIVTSRRLQKNFEIRFQNLLKRKKGTQRGKFGLTNIVHNLINFLRYCGNIVSFSPDIVYMPLAQNRFGFLRDSIFIIAGKIMRRRLCIHFHGGNFDLFYKDQKSIFRNYIRFVLGRIGHLILLANKFEKHFLPFMKQDKITVVYNCLTNVSVPEKNKEYLSFEKRTARVIFIGYISKAKGALDLVKAAPYVIANYRHPVEFILCGQPIDIERNIVFIPEPHFGNLKSREFIAQNNLGSRVRILPEIQDQEKERIFSEADIFVLPSYSEGCALTVLEAMAFGLPIVTTPIGALEEMLIEGENCFFVKPGAVEDISKRVLFLLNNPALCRKIGEANKKLVKERYNSDIFLNNLIKVWDNILRDN